MNRLRELRKTRGLTSIQLAEILDLSESAVRYIERGERGFSMESLKRACDYFRVSSDYLIGRSAEDMLNDFADSVNREFTEDVVNSDGSVVQKYRDASPAVCRKLEIVKVLRDLNDIEALDEILQLVKLKQAQGDFTPKGKGV